jgi:hypothetical protein
LSIRTIFSQRGAVATETKQTRREPQMDADGHRFQTNIFGIYLLCCIKKSHMRANDFPMKQLHQTVLTANGRE